MKIPINIVMAQNIINVGTSANSGDGDTVRDAFIKVNANFTELYNTDNTGYTGSKGDIGYTGSQGDTGLQGEFGYTGSKGDVGYVGSQGHIGYTGSQGPNAIGAVPINTGPAEDGSVLVYSGQINEWRPTTILDSQVVEGGFF